MVPEPDFACFQRYTRTPRLLDTCNGLVQQLWGFAAGLVCIQSPAVELRMGDFEISRFLEGAPTEEPRPDASNARR
jgi:hypothetical protein